MEKKIPPPRFWIYTPNYVICKCLDPSPSVCGTEDPAETDEDQIESNPEEKFITPEQKPEPEVYDKEMDTLQKLFPQKPKVRS